MKPDHSSGSNKRRKQRRVKGGDSLKELIQKELKRKVPTNENGIVKQLSMAEIIMKTLVQEAMKGNPEAIDIIAKFFPHVDVRVINFTPDFGDKKIITDEEDLPETHVEDF